MNLPPHKQKLILLIIGLLIAFSSHAQSLIESRQSSYYTYIYKITEAEAETIYKNNIWKVDSSFFHSLVDSFPTDSSYEGKLLQGHYLKTYAEQNKQKLAITTIQDFDVFIFNNNTDLCIQVYDLQGHIITDTDLRVRGKKLRFNEKAHAYLDKKSNKKGLLKVTHNGFSAYYKLSRDYNNSFVKRGSRKLIYGTPLKYAWMPVDFVISLPIDGVKSVKRGWAQGTIARSKQFFVRSYEKVACWFDDYYCNDNKFSDKHKGYMVFSKPKYQPGDTVKMKAYLVTKKGKPIDKELQLVLNNWGKNIHLAKLTPYRDGGYKYEFYLHDSLDLKLDQNYWLRLKHTNGKEYISSRFKYEDYELSKNKLVLRVNNKKQFRNKKATLYAKGTDENELNLMDARLEVLVTPKRIIQYFNTLTFVPDTLLFLEKKLEPIDETEIVLPDSIFPKVNLDYNIHVRLITSDNEVISEKETITYYYESNEFDVDVKIDSIHFKYLKNGDPQSKQVSIHSKDKFGNKTLVYEGATPCAIEFSPYFSSYIIQADSLTKSVDVSTEPSLIQCLSERTNDSLSIVVNNPRKIPFLYNIYKKNQQQALGYTDSLQIHKKSTSKQNYFVSIRYLWGGKVKEDNFKIPLIDKKLNISVTEPKIVYPGQKSKIDILVTDTEGKPVEGVDLTAYSLTKKFDYTAPQLPYLGKYKRNKAVVNNFSFENLRLKHHTGLQLNYNAWKLLAGIDSIEYYKFIYPENDIYQFEYTTTDSITQFAPFVVSRGANEPIHVIYVDNKPVYFSWSTHTQPYAFPIDSGYHHIKLRTAYREFSIDSLYFEEGKKQIFSFDQEAKNRKISNKQVDAKLSHSEKRLLYKYIVPYRDNFGEQYAYLEQNGSVQFLKPKLKNQRNNFAGPFVWHLTFRIVDGFSTPFYHEPYFEYDFSPALLKMRSIDTENYPDHLLRYKPSQPLADTVLTKSAIEQSWKNYIESKRYLTARYRYPHSTNQGAGKLLLNFKRKEESAKELLLNILVFRHDNHNFLRVYPGNTSSIHELEKGYYQLLFFYSGAKYHIADSVLVQANGLNYYKIEQPEVLKKDSFSLYVSELIEETLFKPKPYYDDEEKELKQIYKSYQQQFKYTGEGKLIEGYVYEAGSNEPMPGVTVIVKGTTFGTITDLDGFYSLKVPTGNNTLHFSFIGFASENRQINHNDQVNITLTPDVQNLDEVSLNEVVVVGYGVMKKSSMTGSVSTITSSNLINSIPGVSGNISQSLQGRVAGVSISDKSREGGDFEISIRGTSSVSFEQKPLLIINGNVYTGDISDLDPSVINNINILKDSGATALYGARGANGVVIIETEPGGFKTTESSLKGADYDETFLEAAKQSSSIRNNFSDDAFWQPDLITDKEGKTSFEVVFPDDVTSWETFYLAMNDKKQAGQAAGLIKSYKPLMAQLAVPRFLVQSDTTYAIGKVLNYTPDSVEVNTKFELNGEAMLQTAQVCKNARVDTLTFVAASDSVRLKYSLETKDSYFDGEQRDIPIFPKGLEATKGYFYVLDKDTSFQLTFEQSLGTVNLYARADVLDIIEDEISHLRNYKYFCNEQIGSKLKALLAAHTIALYKEVKFKDSREVEKLIRLLNKNKKESGLWGWWKNSEESLWISLHILEALAHAEALGYKTSINKDQLSQSLVWELENSLSFQQRIQVLKILNFLGSPLNNQAYITDIETHHQDSTLNGLLHLIELKQLCGVAYDLDTLETYKKTSLWGNAFYSDEDKKTSLLNNDIQNTLLAYKILKADSTVDNSVLKSFRHYFLENRKRGYWRNTYESAQIIETILPDLLQGKTALKQAELTLTGDINKTVTEFPFEMTLAPTQKVEVSKTGDFPVYFTSYQTYWDDAPSVKKGDFEVTTHFENQSKPFLTAGQEVKLITKVRVKKDAEYVMINIPIPGGCSYADKRNHFRNEAHREYFKHETAIFCNDLPKGDYTFEVKLIPRYSGNYTLNPAKVELMYFPTFNANNEIKKIKIK